jgi:hypothetical protein
VFASCTTGSTSYTQPFRFASSYSLL